MINGITNITIVINATKTASVTVVVPNIGEKITMITLKLTLLPLNKLSHYLFYQFGKGRSVSG